MVLPTGKDSRRQRAAGPRRIWPKSSAFAGAGFISPAHYRRFVLPFEKAVIDGIRAGRNIPVYTHTCGSIGDRLELIAETGTDGIDTLDPPPLGDVVDLVEAKRRIGGRLFIKGNLDPVNVLLQGNPESVHRAARDCLEAAARGGAYILSSACSVAPRTPPENLMQLQRASEEYARKSGTLTYFGNERGNSLRKRRK
jgi:uroporphyrinogen decarboxylase